jgi:hypothetical protein
VVIADPCKQVRCRSRGGPDGLVQDGALALLDEAACHRGSSREELALALVDKGRHAPTRTSTELIHVRRATYYSTRSASATAQEAERSDAGALRSEQASERSVIRRLPRTNTEHAAATAIDYCNRSRKRACAERYAYSSRSFKPAPDL